jgi:long-chain acyl-CoA synthetase
MLACSVVDPHDLDHDQRLGEPGLLLARGPGVLRDYWRDQESTAAAFHHGWFNTGAFVSKRSNHYIFVRLLQQVESKRMSGSEHNFVSHSMLA